MPRHKDSEVEAAFSLTSDPGKKCLIARCRYCTSYTHARNVSRQREHLLGCLEYQETINQRNPAQGLGLSQPGSESREDIMNRRHIVPFSSEEKHLVDLDAATAVYNSATPFSTLNNPEWVRFLHRLDPSYYPPSRDQLAGHLLDEVYANVTTKVNDVLSRQQFLHLVMDESDDISGNRIINLSILTTYGAFHYTTESSGSMRHTAENLAQWAIRHIESIMQPDHDWKRINSFITDTCATMRRVWDILSQDPRLEHVLYVPCDSHGLQLLIKDFLTLEPFKTTLLQCQSIANAFKNHPLQYQFLAEHQQQIYGKQKHFVLSVITRWGSQVGLISSVINNRDAIRAYILDPRQNLTPLSRSEVSSSPSVSQKVSGAT